MLEQKDRVKQINVPIVLLYSQKHHPENRYYALHQNLRMLNFANRHMENVEPL